MDFERCRFRNAVNHAHFDDARIISAICGKAATDVSVSGKSRGQEGSGDPRVAHGAKHRRSSAGGRRTDEVALSLAERTGVRCGVSQGKADGISDRRYPGCNRSTSAAAAVMLKLMADPDTPHRLGCVQRTESSAHAKSAIEIEEIEARVAALEQAAEPSKQSR